MSLQNIVGAQMRILRQKVDPPVTQQELSVRLQLLGWDIDRFGISKIERGQRQVTDKEVTLIATALQIPIEWLFSADGSAE